MRPAHLQVVAPQARHPMAQRAARLWPESPALQREWLRAVSVVRCTRRGWLLDQPQPKGAA